jgi:hypothetical protein
MSLSDITFYIGKQPRHYYIYPLGTLTFSCLRCLRSLSSRYVLLDKTGVLKGFIIFFTATFCPVRRSLAELRTHRVSALHGPGRV